MRVTLNKVNARIADKGYELVKGYGYFYFFPLTVDSAPLLYDSMVMVNRLNDFDVESWVRELDDRIENNY